MRRKPFTRATTRAALAVTAVLAIAAGCADEGGQLFGDASDDRVRDDGVEYQEDDVFDDPASLQGKEVAVRARVDEILAPGIVLLRHDGTELLVMAEEAGTADLDEGGYAHVDGTIRRYDFGTVGAEIDPTVHDTLRQYESPAFIEGDRIYEVEGPGE